MKIMLIGSGGREHALAWKLAQSDLVEEVVAIPGNPGIAREPKCRCLELSEHAAMAEFATAYGIDLTVVGPEGPLVEGIADLFRSRGLAIFGPGQAEAQLEGSKDFAKRFMMKHGAATARYQSFTDSVQAKDYVRTQSFPLVVKASGLCAGKGVIICQNEAQALEALAELMENHCFQEAGSTVVIEEFLTGPEVSILSLYDGENIHILGSAMDHKRAFDGDLGPNTGGMGTIAPAPFFSPAAQADFLENILKPTERGLKASGMKDPACIFFGLMLTPDGVKLLEYNMRFGDPETQSVLMVLESDLAQILDKAVHGQLTPADIQIADETALCVIGAAQGYPGVYAKGIPLKFNPSPDIKVFLAGATEQDGELRSSGGRIFGACARGSREEARSRIMDFLEQFRDQPIFWRRDIGGHK